MGLIAAAHDGISRRSSVFAETPVNAAGVVVWPGTITPAVWWVYPRRDLVGYLT